MQDMTSASYLLKQKIGSRTVGELEHLKYQERDLWAMPPHSLKFSEVLEIAVFDAYHYFHPYF